MIEFPDEPALIPYFTAGHPSPDSVPDVIEALERGGADVIEVGLPFSEP
ncbi:MAG: tryptophan synthase subunit alpha, partial [Halobacteria archaeon]|nr:tryptophan synthase subunit alpha [Halobacteria archaeon]